MGDPVNGTMNPFTKMHDEAYDTVEPLRQRVSYAQPTGFGNAGSSSPPMTISVHGLAVHGDTSNVSATSFPEMSR